ncbi:HNH endonuclease signature motif containing protein [Specibacter cremeus]|uniref:HNH endonuclease signature motif containing protein n=1 Tax=Specibacter cremeus TaxID=1629051 RepID=UPI000F7ADB10|nr:HNH endonuclease signature motif containing protein [Specibacter cremeus]
MDTEQLAPDHAGAPTTRGSAGGTIRRLIGQATTLTASLTLEDVGADALGLGRMGDMQAVRFARDVESLAGIQLQAAAELSARAAAGRYEAVGAATPTVFLAEALRISTREAGARLRLGTAVLPRTDPCSVAEHPPVRPVLGAAVLTGGVSREAAAVIDRHAREAEHLIGATRAGAREGREPAPVTAADVAEVEAVLTGLARTERPELVDRCGQRILAHLDPDGHVPSEGELRAKEGLHFARPRNGLVHFEGWMETLAYETLIAAIGTATNPRTPGNGTDHGGTGQGAGAGTDQHTVPGQQPLWAGDPDAAESDPAAGAGTTRAAAEDGLFGVAQPGTGQGADTPALRDGRTRAQHLLHQLLDCVTLAAATDTLPDNGGLRPQLHVTLHYEDLKNGLGTAHLPFTGDVPARLLRQAACDADLIPLVLGSTGAVLDEGRRHRLVTPAIRRALIARDGGCAFPDCERPPHWTEAHHVKHWSHGGPTSVANCVLLCGYHHHLLHRTRSGTGTATSTATHPTSDRQHSADG